MWAFFFKHERWPVRLFWTSIIMATLTGDHRVPVSRRYRDAVTAPV